MKRILFSLIAFCLTCICYSQVQKNKYSIVISNANIVDVINNKVIPHQLLAISGNTIAAIDDASKEKTYKARQYVNAENKYIPVDQDIICNFIPL
jgi:adenine deaminase